MLYVLYGPDTQKGREKLHALTDALLKKRPDALLFRLSAEEVSPDKLEELATARGLFTEKHIVVLDQPFALSDAKALVLDALELMADSQNVFVLFEGEVDAKTLAKLKKRAEKIQLHSGKGAPRRAAFNRFALTDALGRRDRKNLWVLYERARLASLAEEEMHGLLFWQVKSMILAKSASGAESAGLKPFVFSKARLYAKNFSDEELAGLARGLTELYHEARRGKHELGSALERFILGV